MSKHRREPPPRVRPRPGRVVTAALALTVTAVALLGGLGVIPLGGTDLVATHDQESVAAATGLGGAAAALGDSQAPVTGAKQSAPPAKADPTPTTAKLDSTALPAGTGNGRRVVFSMSKQRVWLVDAAGKPVSTYLVSGSLTNNLRPGNYEVFSRSRWAVGIEDSGVMQYFVRFTRGNNAAIGFHSIPTKNGEPLQTVAQLGTPQSHGCIRQKMTDAERMWKFAPDGTEVVVIA